MPIMSLTAVPPPPPTLLERNRRFQNQLPVVSSEIRCPSTHTPTSPIVRPLPTINYIPGTGYGYFFCNINSVFPCVEHSHETLVKQNRWFGGGGHRRIGLLLDPSSGFLVCRLNPRGNPAVVCPNECRFLNSSLLHVRSASAAIARTIPHRSDRPPATTSAPEILPRHAADSTPSACIITPMATWPPPPRLGFWAAGRTPGRSA